METVAVLLTAWGGSPKGINVVWLEDFDGGVPGSMTQYRFADTTQDGWIAYPSSAFNFSAGPLGDSSVGHPSYSSWGDSCEDWLVSPQISVPNSGSPVYLSFYYGTRRLTVDYKGVLISTGSPDPADSDYQELIDLTDSVSNDTWTKITLDLSDYAGQTVYIAFRYKASGLFSSQEWLLDSVMVYEELTGTVDYAVALVSPTGGFAAGDTITPSAWVYNLGDYDADSIPVFLSITDLTGDSLVYADTQAVLSLTAGDSTLVEFSPLSLEQAGPYLAEVRIGVADDDSLNNADASRFGILRFLISANTFQNLPPNIDGVLDDPAWAEAETLDISDFLGTPDTTPDEPGTALMMALHNYQTLYLAFVIKADSNEDTYDQVHITFDDNNDDQWPDSDSTEGVNAITHSAWYYAYYTQSGWSGWRTLSNPPEFATSYDSGYLTVEVALPIVNNPADDQGPWTLYSTVSQNSSDTVGAFIDYVDGGNSQVYAYWPQDNSDVADPAGFGGIVLVGGTGTAEKGRPVRTFLVALGLSKPVLLLNLERASRVSLELYDAAGRMIKKVFSGQLDAGLHRFALEGLRAGVYEARLVAGQEVHSVKLVVK